jgi:multiple sugar transport system permease protein
MTLILLKKLGFFICVTLSAIFSLAPFLLFVSSAFKTQTQVTAIPPRWLPAGSLEFFHSAIAHHGILQYLLNSTIVAGTATLVTISLGILAGYALARLPRRLAQMILMGILACAMFPQIAIAGPIWRFLRLMGWLNTYQGLILPYAALTLPLAVWILSLFFREMPEELESAALVDGCSKLGALMRVILPLSAPGVFTAAILSFIYAWNEFFLALLIMTDPVKQTMPVGIALFQGEHTIPWGEIAAASFITTAPLVLMVLLFQRRIVTGLSAGAIKG